jgi:tripartite-type tricarboxylate transporter receptor subunit TctC
VARNLIGRRLAVVAGIAAAFLPFAAAAQTASAGDYPAKSVRVLVGLAPGGGTDIQARLFAQKLTEYTGRSFVIDNRTGAGGTIAYRAVAAAPADGYTLLAVSGGYTITPSMYQNLPYDPIRDFAPISIVVQSPFILIVHPSLPAKSVKELLALARAKPGALSHGSAGYGSSTHLAFELFRSMARLNIVHVPYKGSGPALVDTMAGQVQMLIANVLSASQHVKSGKLRALGVTSAKRSAALPELPTVAEGGVPGYETTTWHGWLAPGGTPATIIAKINADLARAAKSPEVMSRLAPDGSEPVANSPEQFRQFIVTDIARWRKVIQESGIKPEQ